MPSTQIDRIDGITTSAAVKVPCKICVNTPITLSGVQTIQSILLTAYSGPGLPADRVLVTGQADQTANGIYLVQTGAWTREPDFDGARDAVTGTHVSIISGTYAGTQWGLTTTDNPITIGTSNIVFAQEPIISLTYVAVGTSVTSNTIGTGAKTFTTQSNLPFGVGQFLTIADSANGANYFHGQVTSYSGTTLIMNVLDTGGAGTKTAWTITLGAANGATGASGAGIQWSAGAGTVSAITTTFSPTISSLTDGLTVGVRATGANTSTTPTLQVDSTTAHTIVQRGGLALDIGSIPGANYEMIFRYNLANTRFELLNPAPVGKQPIFIPAAAMQPRTGATQAGCTALATTAGASNQPDIDFLSFATGVDQYAKFSVDFGKAWDAGTVTAKFIYQRASGTGAANIIWGIRGLACATAETPVTNFGTGATVTTAVSTVAANVNISAETGACTLGSPSSPAASDECFFEVYRQGSSGSDTLGVAAYLIGILLYYNTTKVNDA